ncbi:MAG TPA: hypothetical protein VJT49_27975 [Amycolatopsis sp.]|nr:hypothetical protein [Amycolatopsis sp.]HKS48879.1 hypothetical protein [Amycolatopsis sp.]
MQARRDRVAGALAFRARDDMAAFSAAAGVLAVSDETPPGGQGIRRFRA